MLAAQGLANKQIARRLGISESTVKVHIGSIFRRISVWDRTSAALWARENLPHCRLHRRARGQARQIRTMTRVTHRGKA